MGFVPAPEVMLERIKRRIKENEEYPEEDEKLLMKRVETKEPLTDEEIDDLMSMYEKYVESLA